MKIRNFFVSNSSSSSFVVAYKGDNFAEDFDSEIVSKLDGQSEFVRAIISEVGLTIDENIDASTIINKPIPAADKYYDDYYPHDYYPLTIDEVNELIADGFKVASGSISDEDGGMAAYLRYEDIKHIENNIRIYLGEE